MQPRRNATPGPSSQDRRPGAARMASNSGPAEGTSAVRSGLARKSATVAANEPPRSQNIRPNAPPLPHRHAAQLVSKQASSASRPPRRALGPQAQGGPRNIDNDALRKVVRKTTSVAPVAPRLPQSSFTYVAPLLRTSARPAKSTPQRAPFLVAQEEREKRARQDEGQYALGSRSAPRMSLPSMSVQRRVGQSPRKTAQRTPVRADRPLRPAAIPKAYAHVGRKGKLIFGSGSDSDSADQSSDGNAGRSGVIGRDMIRARPGQIGGARKIAPSLNEGDQSSDENSSDDITHRPNVGRKRILDRSGTIGKSRKTAPHGGGLRIAKAARKLHLDDLVDDPPRSLGKKARKLGRVLGEGDLSHEDIIELTESDSGTGSEGNIEELRDAFDALTLREAHLQKYRRLPFLLRNLRDGFEARCRQKGIRIAPESGPSGAVKVVYQYVVDDGNEESYGSDLEIGAIRQRLVTTITRWECPICTLHKPFRTRDMLVFHLEKDHVSVNVAWTEMKVGDQGRHWSITLVLPNIKELETSSEESDSDTEDDVAPDIATETTNISAPSRAARREPLFLPGSDSDETPPQQPVTPPALPVEPESEDVKPVLMTPRVKRRQSPGPSTGRPSLSTAAKISYRGTLPERYPSPPPPTDRLGPAAQYPFLPETTPDGEPLYSCRIGGPRLFDLLNTLPMDDFGIMSWEIIDREEELFEMEDVRDEDKVMLALWNRWIMLNRPFFVMNEYLDGVIKFIDEYWEIIHKASGWRALRAFFLMMSVNKYLKFDDVLAALKHYEEHTGMELWYKDSTVDDASM